MPFIILTLTVLAVSVAAFLLASTSLRHATVDAERKFRDRLASLVASNDQFCAKLLRDTVESNAPVLDCIRVWQREKATLGVSIGPGRAPHDWGQHELQALASREREESLVLRRNRIRTAWIGAQGLVLAATTVVGLVLHRATVTENSTLSSAPASEEVRR